MPRSDWTIPDILDFEYLLASGDDPAGSAGAGGSGRREFLRRWLEARRRSATRPLPGSLYRAGWQALLGLAGGAGLVVGVSLATGLLRYTGHEPVNVFWFLVFTVGIQVALLGLGLGLWIIHRLGGLAHFHPLRTGVEALAGLLGFGLRRLPGARRERIRAALATLRHRQDVYGSILAWPPLLVTQLFGVSFNVGVLAALLLHVTLSDVAFGWQSTLRTGPDRAHALAAALAAPWAFAPAACPSREEVAGSRFRYDAGAGTLAPGARASWWPFLAYAVGFYGLLPRVLLLGLAAWRLRLALAALPFDHAAANALFRRLGGPLVSADAGGASLEISADGASPRPGGWEDAVAFIADELAAEDFAGRFSRVWPVRIDHPSANAAALAEAAALRPARLAIVVPARRAPIKAIALFVRAAAAAAGTAEVGLLLAPPAREEDVGHWRNFNAIHGLHVGLETLP